MTTAKHRNPGRLSVPLTQNTAPVFEFNCLYSQDVTRKHKRWKDGFLKYHTFNRRVLVYDLPRNLIGDMHWLGEEDVQEGDELKLEKGYALVQVADRIGETETDLTELRKSKNRTASEIVTSSPISVLPKQNIDASTIGSRRSLPLQNKSLNTLLGTPKGPLGKAVLPTTSPFDHRYGNTDGQHLHEGRPAKRQRTTDAEVQTRKGPFRDLEAKAAPSGLRNTKSLKSGAIDDTIRAKNVSPRHDLVIDLSDDSDNDRASPSQCDDGTRMLSSSPTEKRVFVRQQQKRPTPSKFQNEQRHASDQVPHKPPIQRMQSPRLRERRTVEHQQSKRISSFQAQGSGQEECSPTTESAEDENTNPRCKVSKPSRAITNPKVAKTLRLAVTAPKKKMLFCQQQPTVVNTKQPSFKVAAPDHSVHRTDEMEIDDSPHVTTVRETLSQRLRRIDEKKGSTSKRTVAAPTKIRVEVEISSESEESEDDDISLHDATSPHKNSDITIDEVDTNAPNDSATPEQGSPAPLQPEIIPSEELLLEEPATLTEPNTPDTLPHQHERKSPSTETTTNNPSLPMEKPNIPDPTPTKSVQKAPLPTLAKEKLPIAASVTHLPAKSKYFQQPEKPPSKPAMTESPEILGPWSREAFDLFTWRPPNWDEEKWCLKGSK